MQATIEQDLRGFIMQNFLFGRDETLGNDDSFLERGIIDSTGILELVAYVEQRYNLTLDSDDLVPENLDSVTRLVTFVSGKLNGIEPLSSSDDRRNGQTRAGLQAAVSSSEPNL